MVITNVGADFIALRLGSGVPNFISATEVGYGSGTALVADTTLVAGSVRNIITGSPDFTEARKVTFTTDFNAVQMSGLSMSEFGLFSSGTVLIGSVWAREAFPSITFNGTNESQIVYSLEVINK